MSMHQKPNPTEDEIRDLLPGYALGILEPDELLMVDEYLNKRPDLRNEVYALEEATSRLAFSAPSFNPPIGVKEQILARAQVDIDRSRAPSSATMTGPMPSQAPIPEPSPMPPRAQPFQPETTQQRRPIDASPEQSWLDGLTGWMRHALGWKMYALATTAAIALLAVIFNQAQQSLGQTRVQIAALEADVAQIDAARNDAETQLDTVRGERDSLLAETEDLATANAKLADENQQLVSDLTVQDEELQTIRTQREELILEQEVIYAAVQSAQQFVALSGTNSDASGSLITGSEGSYLVLTGLEPLPSTQTYQLWLIPDGEAPVDSGLITLTTSDPSTIAVELSLGVDEFAAVGLSIEPEGGSEQPTEGAIVLLGTRA